MSAKKKKARPGPLPEILHVAVSRKALEGAIARRRLAADGGKLTLCERPAAAARRGPASHVILHVAARAAAAAGAVIEERGGGRFEADRIPIEYVGCSKLPRAVRGVRRVDAAGGVVVRGVRRLRVLLLRKQDGERTTNVLPKGKRMKREKRKRAAQREVAEETGLTGLDVGEFLARERYFDVEGKKVVFKQVSYYLMRLDGAGARVAVNRDEGFVGSRWASLDEALELTSPVRAHAALRKAREMEPVA